MRPTLLAFALCAVLGGFLTVSAQQPIYTTPLPPTPGSPPPPPPPFPPGQPVPPVSLPPTNAARDQEQMRLLVGTWRIDTGEQVDLKTFNPARTFTSVTEWKKGVRRLFDVTVRSSGVWEIRDGVLVARFTASNNSQLINQIYSSRIVSLTQTELILVDYMGNPRRAIKVGQ